MEKKRKLSSFFKYLVLVAVGLVMVYPLLWMIGATFKSNVEIFSGIGLIPRNPTLDGYRNAMKSYGGDINIWKAMLNTYSYVIPKVLFTLISATITAYGFGRFKFIGRGALFATDTYFVFMLVQFMRSSNDFMGPLLYVKTPAKYPAAIFVKLSMDADNGFEWNRVLATSLISIVPSHVIFFLAQDQFVEGIAAGGVKG